MLLGLQNISFHPGGRPCEPQDILLCFQLDCWLAAKSSFCFPTWAMVKALIPENSRPVILFTYNDTRVYGLDISPTLNLAHADNLSFEPVSTFRQLNSRQDSYLLITAYHLMLWYRNHRFCGHCAHILEPSPIERSLDCPACGSILFPIICPAISVAITDGDRLLLARNIRSSFQHYSLIAGYVEVGESLEVTVIREVKEEVGLDVKSVRYVGSQAWGFSQSLMIGFHAELDGNDQITLQEGELSDARWFHRDEITVNPNPLSLSFSMIEMFRANTLP